MSKWIEKDNALIREFTFSDFKEAWSFMSDCALVAEQQNHHPNWSNVYNKVHIELSTHDAGNIVTDKDRKLADRIDEIFKKHST